MQIDKATADMIAEAVVERLANDQRFARVLNLSRSGDEELLSPKELAALCGCSDSTIRRAIRAGLIEAQRAPGVGRSHCRVLVRRSQLARLVAI